MFSWSTHLLMCLFLETLMPIIRTALPILVELIGLVNSVINDLTQMVNFPTHIWDCDSHSPALLDFSHSSDATICSTMTFPPLGNSAHVVVSVSIDFPSYSKWDVLFHCIAYDHSSAHWDGLCDHDGHDGLWKMFHERTSLNSVLLQLLMNFVSGCRLELMYKSLIKSIGSSRVATQFP